MAHTLPASSRSYRGSHPEQVAAHQRPSGRSHSTRTDRSTITSPTPTRSRTQISPGIHGDQHPDHHNHSPPTLTQAPVQISGSARSQRTAAAGAAESHGYEQLARRCRLLRGCRSGRACDRAPPDAWTSSASVVLTVDSRDAHNQAKRRSCGEPRALLAGTTAVVQIETSFDECGSRRRCCPCSHAVSDRLGLGGRACQAA
jgi:hypothetical protein